MGKCEQCIVKQLNSLQELTKEELYRVSHRKTIKTVKKGEPLFDEGEHINGMFCIKSGVCKVSKISDNGREQIINLVKRGDFIGERSLMNDEVANLKATALNDMEICFIPRDEVVKGLNSNRSFSMSILKEMANSLKKTDNTIVQMAQKTVKQRLAHTLLYLDESFGVKENGAINIQLTREDIANIIGTATESAIRLLSEFKKKNLISLNGKEIVITDKDSLKAVKEGF